MLCLTFSPPRASIRMEALLRRRPVVILCCLRDSLWFTLSLYCCCSVSRWSWIYQIIKTTTYPIDLYQIIELNEFSGLSRNNDWQISLFLKFIWKDLKDNSLKGLATFLRLFCFWARLCSASCRASLASCTRLCFGFTIYAEKFFLIKRLNYTKKFR